jgi:hypothetical protein
MIVNLGKNECVAVLWYSIPQNSNALIFPQVKIGLQFS